MAPQAGDTGWDSHSHSCFHSEFGRAWRLEVFSKTANFWGNPKTPRDSPVDFDPRNELDGFFWAV